MDEKPQALPETIIKRKQAINLYMLAVGAIAAVVVMIPLLSVFAPSFPPELWAGWNICIGGLIALIGSQSKV